MNQVYGSARTLPLGASPIRTAPLPVVPALPGPNAPTPRRRRTIVCSSFTIDGQTWTLDEAKAKMRDALRGDKADLRCAVRHGISLKSDWAMDCCLSSWSRQCPFKEVSL